MKPIVEDPIGEEQPPVGKIATDVTAAPSAARRTLAFVTGIVLPIACFVMCGDNSPIVDAYQSGEMDVYAGLLLVWPSNAPMLPLVGLSIAAMAAWLVRPNVARYLVVRMGIYAGLLLAIQYFVLVCCIGGVIFTLVIGVAILPFLIAGSYGFSYFATKIKRFTIAHLMILTTVVALALTIPSAMGFSSEIISILMGLLMSLCFADPILALLTYAWAARRVWKEVDPAAPVVLTGQKFAWIGSITWLASWLGAWRLSVLIMLEEYEKLPTSPACYVCGVAAHGHRSITKSQWTKNGKHLVSPQLRQIKFLEIVFKAALPGPHRILRHGYDVIGPPIARRLSGCKTLATIGHCCLMPLQLAALIAAKSLGIPTKSIQRIYS